jgi:hypothetical protein
VTSPNVLKTRRSRAVLFSRIGHGLVSAFFLVCIGAIYLGAWNAQADTLTYLALTALGIECILVLSAGGNCPLGPWLQRLGDDKPFFELLLPPRAAKAAIPTLGAIATIGAIALAVRVLL